jgi:hypothetical protein
MCAESDLAMLDHRVRLAGRRQASKPTNHLDLTSIEVRNRNVRVDGTLIAVSHDQTFLEAIGVDKEIIL